jgi:Glycosyltransferase family 87
LTGLNQHVLSGDSVTNGSHVRLNYPLNRIAQYLDEQVRRILNLGLVFIFGTIAVKYGYSVYYYIKTDNLWETDYFGIWSYAKFILAHPAIQIYDDTKLLDFQMDLGASPRGILPYVYPPWFLLLICPIGLLDYYPGYAIWIGLPFLLYLAASIYKNWRLSDALVTVFAPATIIALGFAQTGLLSSTFILGGFRLVASRPILSGALFGLASFKPQLGILIPIALIAARQWRTLVAAGATVPLLVIASSIAFGWSIWPVWLAKLPAHPDWAANVPNGLSPTIIANLTFVGVDLTVARAVQLFVATVTAVAIWFCFRRGVTMLATAALIVGTFLATPYAFVYDMPMLTNAVLMVSRSREQSGRPLAIPGLLVLALALVVPAISSQTWRPAMFRTVPLFLLFGMILLDMIRYPGTAQSVSPAMAEICQIPDAHSRDVRI